MMLPVAVGKDPGIVNFMGAFPQRLPSSGRETHPSFDITPRMIAQSLRHHVIFGGKRFSAVRNILHAPRTS
jgi:hypothetical protein